MNVLTAPAHRVKSLSLQSDVLPYRLNRLSLTLFLLSCTLDNCLFYLKIEQRDTNAFFLYLLTWSFITRRTRRLLVEEWAGCTSAFLGTVYENSAWVLVQLLTS